MTSSSSSAVARTTNPILPFCTPNPAVLVFAAIRFNLNVTFVGVLGLSLIAPERDTAELALVRGGTAASVQSCDACIMSIFLCEVGGGPLADLSQAHLPRCNDEQAGRSERKRLN